VVPTKIQGGERKGIFSVGPEKKKNKKHKTIGIKKETSTAESEKRRAPGQRPEDGTERLVVKCDSARQKESHKKKEGGERGLRRKSGKKKKGQRQSGRVKKKGRS